MQWTTRAGTLAPQDVVDAIVQGCRAAGTPPGVALGVIELESSFHLDALNSTSGATGLLQIKPAYQGDYERLAGHPFNPTTIDVALAAGIIFANLAKQGQAKGFTGQAAWAYAVTAHRWGGNSQEAKDPLHTQRTLDVEERMRANNTWYDREENAFMTITRATNAAQSGRDIFKGKRLLVNMDDGHGMTTAGKRTPPMKTNIDINHDGKLEDGVDIIAGDIIHENEWNRAVGAKYKAAMLRCGVDVLESAPGDADRPRPERIADIKAAGCLVSTSFHFNASGDGKDFNAAQGITIFTANPASKLAAELASLERTQLLKTGHTFRGVGAKTYDLVNEKWMGCPATLIECGFMTNEKEAMQMLDPAYQAQVAELVAQAHCAYFRIPYIAGGAPAPAPAPTPAPVPAPAKHYTQLKAGPAAKPGGKKTVGSKGTQVTNFQRLLNKWRKKHGMGAIDEDGKYGNETHEAVKAFQAAMKLHYIDGIAGDETWNALVREVG